MEVIGGDLVGRTRCTPGVGWLVGVRVPVVLPWGAWFDALTRRWRWVVMSNRPQRDSVEYVSRLKAADVRRGAGSKGVSVSGADMADTLCGCSLSERVGASVSKGGCG